MRIVHKVLCMALTALSLSVSMAVVPERAAAYPEIPLPYRIHVSRTAQIVTVLDAETGECVRQMICSTGAASTPTITGTFRMPKANGSERKNWYAFSATSYAHYASRIKGGYLFHSILYKAAATSALSRVSWTMIGSRASHGCIRMTPLDAQWIAYNCAPGTIVRISDAAPPGPIKSSSTIKRTLPSPRSDGSLPGYEPTLSPTPRPTDDDRPTLDIGAEGPFTKALQTQLKSLGYFSGSVNGKYGNSTKSALAAFQAAYLKLCPDTTEDTNTDGVGTKAWQLRVRDNKENLSLVGTSRTLALGSKGFSVLALRQRLFELGYTSTSATQTYNAYTRDLVKLFQRANGLTMNGKATKAVQDLLLDKDQQPLKAQYVNLNTGLSVRKTASTKGKLVVKLPVNREVRVVKVYGDWSFIVSGKKFGYVQNQYLRDEATVPAA